MNGSKYDSEITNFVVVLNNLFYRLFLFFLSQWVYNCFLFCNNCFWHVHNVKHDVTVPCNVMLQRKILASGKGVTICFLMGVYVLINLCRLANFGGKAALA